MFHDIPLSERNVENCLLRSLLSTFASLEPMLSHIVGDALVPP